MSKARTLNCLKNSSPGLKLGSDFYKVRSCFAHAQVKVLDPRTLNFVFKKCDLYPSASHEPWNLELSMSLAQSLILYCIFQSACTGSNIQAINQLVTCMQNSCGCAKRRSASLDRDADDDEEILYTMAGEPGSVVHNTTGVPAMKSLPWNQRNELGTLHFQNYGLKMGILNTRLKFKFSELACDK